MDADGNFEEEKWRGFVSEETRLGVTDNRCGGRNIYLPVMMPGAGCALLITGKSMAGMIVGESKNDPDAHVERADDR